jgi:MarR family transcriptional regulator, organic hydroperoxide resistance regulator
LAAHSSAPRIAVRPDSPFASRGALLARVAAAWDAQLRSAMTRLELTPAQFRLLVSAAWLTTRASSVRQSAVAAEAGLDPVMTSEVLRALERRGLVTRSPHPNDGRARAITVTEVGGELADRAIRLADAVELAFFTEGMAEFGVLAKALKKGGRGSQNHRTTLPELR